MHQKGDKERRKTMTEYDYSVRVVVRDTDVLQKELLDLGDCGWEVVTILERSLSSSTKAPTGWVIISKKAIEC